MRGNVAGNAGDALGQRNGNLSAHVEAGIIVDAKPGIANAVADGGALPFLALMLWQMDADRAELKRAALAFGGVLAVGILPFLAADPVAFYDDTVRYGAGTYRIVGYGLSAILVEAGVGYAITLDGLADTSPESALCFRPLWPRLESGLDIIWKKYQVFSPAAELFLTRLRALVEHTGKAGAQCDPALSVGRHPI